jgi:hypothetical protein
MSQQENKSRNPEDEDKRNQRTNEESGRHDLNPTDRDESDTEQEFDLDGDKERNLDITSNSQDSDNDKKRGDEKTKKELPPHEDPNVNADKENREENFGSKRNQPNVRTLGSES